MDILKSEEYYEENIVFRKTEAINESFAFFGISDKNFVLNSGSYFMIQGGLLAYCFTKYLINQLSVIFSKNKYARTVGIFVHEDNYLKYGLKAIVKLYMESYFDLIFCTLINLAALMENKSMISFEQFFATRNDIICSIITLFYAVMTIIFPLYGLIMIIKNKDNLTKKKVY
jgi:hypothetical protein